MTWCVKANAKNRMGGYTSRTVLGINFYQGKIIQRIEGYPFCYADNIHLDKFNELKNLKDL